MTRGRGIAGILLFAVALAVLGLGGTEPLTIGIVQALLLLTFAALVVRADPRLSSLSGWKGAVPLVLLAVVLLQLTPLPAAWLSPDRVDPGASYGLLSMDRQATASRLIHLLACVCAFSLALAVAGRHSGARVLIYGLVLLGVFEAGYGLVQHFTGWKQVFFYTKKYSLDAATGTFINRNHFAGLLGMILPFSVALAWLHLGGRGGVQRRASDPEALRGWFWLFLAAVLFLALIFSRSRMGILSVLASVLVMLGLMIAGRQRTVGVLLLLTLLATGIGLAVWVGPEPVVERFGQLQQEVTGPDNRPAIWRDTVLLVQRHPLLGTGLGTFPIAYTQVQTAFLNRFVNSAHNDYLEFAVDLGLPAALLLFGGCAGVVWGATRRVLAAEEDRFGRACALGVAGSSVAILLHSLADFNLQIPANALVFAVVLGLGCAPARPSAPAEAVA